jgi:tetratricopeptide (TPR) repeat protein
MMPRSVTIASTLLLVVSAISASAADKSVWDKCNQIRNTDASIAACTQILEAPGETASDRAIAYSIRGGVYQAKGDSDHAIADFTQAIEINPQDARAYVRRGSVYQVNGDSDHAIADYNKAIEINPLYAIAYFNRGGAFETMEANASAGTPAFQSRRCGS